MQPQNPSLKKLSGFNLNNLMNMVGNDEELVIQLLLTLREDTTSSLTDIEACLNAKNLEGAKKLVHTIKGSSGNLGAVSLHATAEILEAQLKQGQYESEALQNFKTALLETRSALDGLD